MPNTTFQIESNFDNVYFHAKSQVKNKKKYYKINYDTSLKSYDHAELKSRAWKHI